MVFCRWGCEEEEGDRGEQHVVHFGILGVDYLGEGGFVDGEGEEDDWYMLDIWESVCLSHCTLAVVGCMVFGNSIVCLIIYIPHIFLARGGNRVEEP